MIIVKPLSLTHKDSSVVDNATVVNATVEGFAPGKRKLQVCTQYSDTK
jgi:hypothetical protein